MRDVVITYSVAIEPNHTTVLVQATLFSLITVYEPICKGDNGINSLRLLTCTLYRNNTSHELYTREVFHRRLAFLKLLL